MLLYPLQTNAIEIDLLLCLGKSATFFFRTAQQRIFDAYTSSYGGKVAGTVGHDDILHIASAKIGKELPAVCRVDSLPGEAAGIQIVLGQQHRKRRFKIGRKILDCPDRTGGSEHAGPER